MLLKGNLASVSFLQTSVHLFFTKLFPERKKKSSRVKELQNSSHSRSTKEGCVARGVEQEWVWEKEERNRRAANTQGPMESLDLSANAKRTTKALEVGRYDLTSAKTFFWVTTWTEVGRLGLWARRQLKSYLGFLASSHGKPEAREGWNSH